MVVRLKMQWDWGALPLWPMEETDVAVDGLLSASLTARLHAWNEEMEGVAAGGGSGRSEKSGRRFIEEWNRRGRVLARQVLHELGPGYEVLYVDERGMLEQIDADR